MQYNDYLYVRLRDLTQYCGKHIFLCNTLQISNSNYLITYAIVNCSNICMFFVRALSASQICIKRFVFLREPCLSALSCKVNSSVLDVFVCVTSLHYKKFKNKKQNKQTETTKMKTNKWTNQNMTILLEYLQFTNTTQEAALSISGSLK